MIVIVTGTVTVTTAREGAPSLGTEGAVTIARKVVRRRHLSTSLARPGTRWFGFARGITSCKCTAREVVARICRRMTLLCACSVWIRRT